MTPVVLDPMYLVTTARGALSGEECAAWIALAEGLGFAEAPEGGGYARVQLDDLGRASALAGRLAAALPGVVGQRTFVGINERFRVHRYGAGQRLARHHDGSFARGRDRSLLSLLIPLSDGFEGGDVEFDVGRRLVVRPPLGSALWFLHPVPYQVAEVRSGVQYVLRTDVMYRR